MQLIPIRPVPASALAQLNWDFLNLADNGLYVAPELVQVTEKEAEAFESAANTLYACLVEGAQYHIDNGSLDKLGIPSCLHDIIYHTWHDDRYIHLYSRFDLAGGIDGIPIKLLELNADTPTSVPETSVLQWAQLKANAIAEHKQFNLLYESLVEQFNTLATLWPDKPRCLLCSTLHDAPEDEQNVAVIRSAAEEAGFETAFAYIDEVVFAENGVFAYDEDQQTVHYPFWFKLVPYEFIAFDEPELAALLRPIVLGNHTILLNPPYALLLQSKALLATVHKLFPDEPLILPATLDDPLGRPPYPYVRKVLFGREGANVAIFDADGIPIEVTGGNYGDQPAVYQQQAKLVRDHVGRTYQTGVFMAGTACAMSFRRSQSLILDDRAQFVGHMIL